jgi:glucose-6-phosphate 1-dehydrogenase
MLERVVIFGAGGDLARRYLLPALAELLAADRLPAGFEIAAADRGDAGTDEYRSRAGEWLGEHAPEVPQGVRQELVGMIRHCEVDATDAAAVRNALEPSRGPAAVYLALPPAVFGRAIEALMGAGVPAGSRRALEKPFGRNLEHARELNALLRGWLPEESVFRIDHFLGMQTVQNLVGLRFANRVFEPIWNSEHIERVDIVWEETLTLEGRGYYDAVAALRDLVQNHLLQLLAFVAMEPPTRFEPGELGDRKTDLLRAVRRLAPDEVAEHTVRGRYTAGRIGGRAVPAYVDEKLVDPGRGTETFAEVTLGIDNWRWSRTPFVLGTGKALAVDRREILVRFRPVPLRHLAGTAAPNVLRIPLDPEILSLELNMNAPGDEFSLQRVSLAQHLATPDLPAYARVLLAVLAGDRTLSIRGDEAEEAWGIVEPILAAWAEGRSPLRSYPAGTTGPTPPNEEDEARDVHRGEGTGLR